MVCPALSVVIALAVVAAGPGRYINVDAVDHEADRSDPLLVPVYLRH